MRRSGVRLSWVAHSAKKPYVELMQNLSPGWSSTTEAASAAVGEAREDHEVGRRSATLLGLAR
jgi:hypothetical protein